MRSKSTKIVSAFLVVALLIGVGVFVAARLSSVKPSASIIASNFIGYDFARAITGEASEVAMLLKPGTEAHTYEPTPEDIINIQKADLFIYVGGESDAWIEDLILDNEISAQHTLRLMDYVEVKTEELVEGMDGEAEHDHNSDHDHDSDALDVEYDEHIWTSPVNAIRLVDSIKTKLIMLHPDKAALYNENAAAYVKQLHSINQSIRDIVASSNKNTLVFADRFPFRYFVDEYGLDYYAAFPGCAEQTEASSKTIAFLIDKINNMHIGTILKIELTSSRLAESIAAETGAQVLELHSGHNIAEADFDRGVTYVDILLHNVEVLKEALK